MATIDFVLSKNINTQKEALLLVYNPTDKWIEGYIKKRYIDEKQTQHIPITINKVFSFNHTDIVKISQDKDNVFYHSFYNFNDFESINSLTSTYQREYRNNKKGTKTTHSYFFLVSDIDDDYCGIDKEKFGLTFNVFIQKEYVIRILKEKIFKYDIKYPSIPDDFVDSDDRIRTNNSKTTIALINVICNVINRDLIIGDSAIKDGAISVDEFENIIESIPNETEVHHYIKSRVYSVVENYYNIKQDYKKKFSDYMERKLKKLSYTTNELEEANELKIATYQYILDEMKDMLESSSSYSELDWQNKINKMILLIFPQYACVIKELRIINNISYGKIDLCLVDQGGNLDIIEIKKPDCPIFYYDDSHKNYAIVRQMTAPIMQIERYLYNLNRYNKIEDIKKQNNGKNNIDKILNIVNPRGIIIAGRSVNFNTDEQNCFEIVRRQHKNIVDIITYDDLIQRLEFVLQSLQNRE